jgi:hypothetical protein
VHGSQRVLNDLKRAKLSRSRLIRLHARPLLRSSPLTKLDRQQTGRLRKRQLADWRGGGGRGAESYERKKALHSINHSVLSKGSSGGGEGGRDGRVSIVSSNKIRVPLEL